MTSDAFFDYNVQKLCSIIASMATLKFNMIFSNIILNKYEEYHRNIAYNLEYYKYLETLRAAADKGAMFDTRVFNIPKEEVANLIYWRQLDAIRNSIQMCGQANYSQKQLQGLSCEKIKQKLLFEKNFDFNKLEEYKQRGTACFKIEKTFLKFSSDFTYKQPIKESYWYLDKEMPVIKGEDRNYVEKHIYI